jgi:hypothetical protein
MFQYRLSAFENNVLRRTIGIMRKEATGGCRRLQARSFTVYTLHQIHWIAESQRMRHREHVEFTDEMRKTHRNLVVKPEGKRPLEKR